MHIGQYLKIIGEEREEGQQIGSAFDRLSQLGSRQQKNSYQTNTLVDYKYCAVLWQLDDANRNELHIFQATRSLLACRLVSKIATPSGVPS